MKILICTGFFETRSNGTALFPNFALKINELYPSNEIRIITPDVSQSYEKVTKVDFKYPRIFHALHSLLSNFSYFRVLKQIHRKYPFDIVVFNHAASGVLTRFLFRKKIKVIGIIHDDNSLKMERSNHDSIRHYFINFIKKWLEIIAIKHFDAILCPSKYIRCLILQRLSVSNEKLKLLYQTIDIKSIDYQSRYISPYKEIKVLFVKFSYIRGGLFDLIDALGILNDYSFCLTIVGPSTSEKDNIQQKATTFTNIILDIKYYCPPKEVSYLMYNHDILCVPSRAEVLGLANVEGLAHGIPVVSTNVGGIPEVMDNGNNGWLAEPNNPLSLAQTLKDCINASSEVLKTKSDAGRQYVSQNFDSDLMIKHFLDICEKTINA